MTGEARASSDRPWHTYLTIDLIAHILNRSIFHPYIAWLVPLCLRAVATRYDAPEFTAACVWASLVTALAVLGVFDKRIAYGLPREVDWDEEVVVITGGANGLGKILAEVYGMRGASVAVLDVEKPEKESEGLAGVQYYMCDVGNAAEVEKAKARIEKDVCRCPVYFHLIHRTALLTVSLSAGDTNNPHKQRRYRQWKASAPAVRR